MTKSHFNHSWRISRDFAGDRLIDVLSQKLGNEFSNSKLRAFIDERRVFVSGMLATAASISVEAGDLIEILPKSVIHKPKIIFENDHYMIIDKPCGSTCDMSLLLHFDQKLDLVHRLDRDTSGLLILSKTHEAKRAFENLFKMRKVEKLYIAMVHGKVRFEKRSCDNFLRSGNRAKGKAKMEVTTEGKGERAVTHFSTKKASNKASLLVCQPITGRMHQLRVQLSHLGHPILGDEIYSEKLICKFPARRHMLHAALLKFVDPFDGSEKSFKAELPEDMVIAKRELF